jgi:hypothetical protein
VLPTWYFLKTYALEAELKKLEALRGSSRPQVRFQRGQRTAPVRLSVAASGAWLGVDF